MLYIVDYSYYEESPRGGSGITKNEKKLHLVESENELYDEVNKFLNDNRSGYRRNIKLIDIKKVE